MSTFAKSTRLIVLVALLLHLSMAGSSECQFWQEQSADLETCVCRTGYTLNADLKRMAMYSLQDFTPSTTDEFDSTIHGSDYTQAPTNIAGSRVDIFAAFKMNGGVPGSLGNQTLFTYEQIWKYFKQPVGSFKFKVFLELTRGNPVLHYEVSAQRVGNLYQVEEDVTYPTKKYTIDIDDPAIANLILNKQIDLHLKIVFGVALDLTVKHSGSEDSETFSRGLLEFEDASPNVAIFDGIDISFTKEFPSVSESGLDADIYGYYMFQNKDLTRDQIDLVQTRLREKDKTGFEETCTGAETTEVIAEDVQCSRGYFNNGTGGSLQCVACRPGAYKEELGSAECDLCPVATGNPRPHSENASDCKVCQAGTFASSHAVGASACLECARGEFQTEPGKTECEPCPAGTALNETGGHLLANCSACPPGQFSDKPASHVCTPCALGNYTDRLSSTTCLQCSPGSHANVIGSRNCTLCVAGKYAEDKGMAECDSCKAGKFATASGSNSSDNCEQCGQGEYSDKEASTSCIKCDPGKQQPGFEQTSCFFCDEGKFAGGRGVVFCENCNPGKFASTTGMSQCTNCSVGEFADAFRASSCTKCDPGEYSNGPGQSHCVQCAPGKFSTITAAGYESNCSLCSVGEFQPLPGSTACEQCWYGMHGIKRGAVSTTEGCRRCVDGKYGDGRGLLSCKSCPAGKYDHTVGGGARYGEGFDSLNVCRNCEPNTYSNGSAAPECLLCPPNSVSYAGMASKTDCECAPGYTGPDGGPCLACTVGKYKSHRGAAECQDCPAGTYNDKEAADGRNHCEDCPANSNSTQGSINITNCSCMVGYTGPDGQACENCEAGKFKNVTGSSPCTNCSAGTKASTAQTVCDACVPGKYSDQAAPTCTLCPKGTFANLHGMPQCTACNKGKSLDLTGANSSLQCLTCPTGKYANETGMAQCTLCEAGTANENNGSVTRGDCKICGVGYSSLAGSSTCSFCPAGKFKVGDVPGECEECVKGKYAADIASTSCSWCEVGKYNEGMGNTGCDFCNEGEFCAGGDADPTECTGYTVRPWTASCNLHIERFGGDKTKVKLKSVYLHDREDISVLFASIKARLFAAFPSEQGKMIEDAKIFTGNSCEPGFGYNDTTQTCNECEVGKFEDNNVCHECPAGWLTLSSLYLTTGRSDIRSVCDDCDAGKFAAQGAEICSNCDAGTYSVEGAEACTNCTAGTFSGKGAETCPNCLAGKFSGEMASACTNCTAGMYSGEGAEACTNCTAGTFSGKGAETCSNCTAGTFSGKGAGTCSNCDAGTFSGARAAACVACSQGTYSNMTGQSACVSCPANFTTTGNASTSAANCSVSTVVDLSQTSANFR